MSDKLRVVILSHGHPEFSQGGVEHLSYTLFHHLRSEKDVTATYLSRVSPQDIGHDGDLGNFRGKADDIIWAPPPIDWFRFASLDRDKLRLTIHEILSRLQPDVLHVQHFVGTGLDLLEIVKKDFGIPIVYTLQEYLPICFHNGQMVKNPSHALCYESSYSECARCFPDYSSGKFFLRKQFMLSMLAHVDRFIAPSHFIRERYNQWGIADDRIEEIDYLLPASIEKAAHDSGKDVSPATKDREGSPVYTFGFFGQINPYKGVRVLLAAARLIPETVRPRVRIVIFGTNQHNWGEEFVANFEKGIADSSDILSYHGPYKNEQVVSLMRSMDWTLVPSTWWENSPVVIHEAKAAGRPILCSNIGGMREKVRDGIDGVHFLADSAVDLARKITDIALGKIRLEVRPTDIQRSNRERLNAHLRIYRQLSGK